MAIVRERSQKGKKVSRQSFFEIGLATALIVVVCAAVFYVHRPALSAKALSFDDNQYLIYNVLVQNPGWTSAKRFLTEVLEPSTVNGYYQPLAMISLMLDYALGGRENNLLPFHRTSLILHVANTALIIVLLYLLFGQACGEQTCLERSRKSRTIWVAAAVGLLFGVHPITVEPIPWVGERKTLLAAFFSLCSLILYIYPRVANRRQRAIKFYIGSFLMYLLALMSKPTSIPLPAVMLLMDYWPLRRLNWRAILEKLPFFAAGGISAVVTYVSQNLTAGMSGPVRLGFVRIPLILCHNIIFYLYKIVWPVNLSSHYPFPEPSSLSHPMVLTGVIGTGILLPLLVLSLRWTRAAFTGWLIFFVAILPAMQIIGFSDVVASDKFAYLPSLGLLMVLASFLGACWRNCKAVIKFAVALVVIASAAAETIATQRYLVYWRDSVTLYEHMLTLTPNSAEVYNGLGYAFHSKGKVDDEIRCFRKAMQLKPNYPHPYCNLGNALARQGKLDEAISCYRRAIQLKPDYIDAHNNLGLALSSQGRTDEAVSQFHQALQISPHFSDAYYNLAITLKSQGKLDEAISNYRLAIQNKPNYAEAHYNLGNALEIQGKPDEAANHYREAIRLNPDDAKAHNNLGIILKTRGRLDEAITQYRQALQSRPDYAEAHNNLGNALILQNKLDEAVDCYRRSVTIDPNYAEAYNNLGIVLGMQGKTDEAISNFQTALRIKPDFVKAKALLEMALKSGQKSSP